MLTVRAGAGGVDAEDWAQKLAGMYLSFAARRGWKVQTVELTDGREDGLRSGSWIITGARAFGLLRGEHGAHRVAHHSRFGARGKRQTSFAAVEVLPWRARPPAGVLEERDIEITTYAGSSKGGQHANRSATNVRAVHRPTAISAVSQGRSLEQNKQRALAVLAQRVQARRAEDEQAAQSGVAVSAGFGGRVRSYVFTPYQLVKDERCGFKSRRLDAALAGDLDELMWELLLWRAAQPRAVRASSAHRSG